MLALNFTNGLIPVVVQEVETKEVLMVAYANADAVNLTRETGYAHFFSRSRKKIWKKGKRVVIYSECSVSSSIAMKTASSMRFNRQGQRATPGTRLVFIGRWMGK